MDVKEHRDDPPNHAGKQLGGSGTDSGWSVEARYAYYEPKVINGMMLDDRWRTVHFNDTSPIGVPRGPRYHSPWLAHCGLYSYQSAQALRWWFIAQAEAELLGSLCLETRLVKHKITYSYHHTAETAHEVIGGDDRSNTRPVEPKQPAKAA
jgi:hypothetical protein